MEGPSLVYPLKQCSRSIYYNTFQKKKFRNPKRLRKKFKERRPCACTDGLLNFPTGRTFRSSKFPSFFSPLPFPPKGSLRRCPCDCPCGQCKRTLPWRHSFCKFCNGHELLGDDDCGKSYVPSVKGKFCQLAGSVFHHLGGRAFV